MPTPSTPDGDAERWREIISSGEAIQKWISGLNEASYLADAKTCAAVAMNLIVIGEAANRMSDQTQSSVDLPWPQIASLRNRIAHGYATIDHARVWRIVSLELAALLATASEQLSKPTL